MNTELKERKIPKKLFWGWPLRGISVAVGSIFLSYVTYYGTNVLGMKITTVSLLLMLSKIFDGVSDIIAGYIIDRTHTRWGKGRPYDLAIIGYWLCIVLLFSTPNFGETGKAIYMFVTYTLVLSVFGTLFFCAEPAYLAAVAEESAWQVKLLSFGGVLSTIGGVAGGVILPQLFSAAGTNPASWSRVAIITAIPMTLIGVGRFLLVPETRVVKDKQADQINLSTVKDALASNKFIWIVGVLTFISYFASNLTTSVSAYYAQYILGDLGINSILSLTLISSVIVMMITPSVTQKFGMKKSIMAYMVINIVGNVLRVIFARSVLGCLITGMLGSFAFVTFYGFAQILVLECVDYSELKTGKRYEGVMSSIKSVMDKIGPALATGVSGLMLGLTGFDGNLATQSTATENMIIGLTAIAPIIFTVVFMVIYHFYTLDKQIPEIRAQLAERNAVEP